MAQLVFVHGVATRDTPEYRAAIANRDTLFRELLFTGSNAEIHSPMWDSSFRRSIRQFSKPTTGSRHSH